MPDLTESDVAMARIIDALFCSELRTGDQPTKRQLAASIRSSLKTHRNWNACTRTVAAEFAKAPVRAAERESWCRQLAEDALKGADILLDANCL
jgi:hypothetical protein